MNQFSEMDDFELVELEVELKEQQPTPQPLKPTEDVPDESAEALKTLVEVTRERKARMIPDVVRRGIGYEVVYQEQSSADAAEFKRDRFENPEDRDSARRLAIGRAVEIGLALRDQS